MPAGNTYESIATQTLGSAAASVTFSSIPSTYTDLVLITQGSVSASGASIYLEINGDTASNYSFTYIYGSGSAAASARATNNSTGIDALGYNSGFSTGQLMTINHFMNYSNTTTNKTVLCRGSDAGSEVGATVGLWRNTSAITSIKVKNTGSNFTVGHTFSLYGIKAA
jgi:hypothetical protein